MAIKAKHSQDYLDYCNTQLVYQIVNEVYSEMIGQKTLEVVDTQSLVSMGNKIDSMGQGDLFTRTLLRRIGLTIDGYRDYTSKFSVVARSELEWGSAVQKIKVEMPDVIEAVSANVGIMDGQSVDQYKIYKNKTNQKIFEKVTPYVLPMTMQTEWLTDAFLNPAGMQSYITQCYGVVANRKTFAQEELARICLCSYMGSVGENQIFPLLTMYNNETGAGITSPTQALYNEEFLRYMIATMNLIAQKMSDMSVFYNTEGFTRFTPKDKLYWYMNTDVLEKIRTNVVYGAYNESYVNPKDAIPTSYWQAPSKEATPKPMDFAGSTTINVKTETHPEGVIINNIVAVMFDYEALGTFRKQTKVRVTPENALGLYINTFWHEKHMYFNDMSENGVIFTLN